ncbi:hypothetical protein Tco_0187389, partial [Tanacetum coccineum]
MDLAGFQPLMYLAKLRPASLQGNPLGSVLPQMSLVGTDNCDRVRLECVAYEIDWCLNRAPFSHQDRTNSSVGGGQACSASGVQWKSLFLMHFFKVLNSGKDFSADLERNLFRLANFPLR